MQINNEILQNGQKINKTDFFSSLGNYKQFNTCYFIASAVLSAIQLICLHYEGMMNSSEITFGSVIINILIFAAMGIAFYALIVIFEMTAHYLRNRQNTLKVLRPVYKWLNRWPVLKYCCILLLGWLPAIIRQFPGILCPDSLYQIEQWVSIYPLNTHHPLLNTRLVGLFINIGYALGSANTGMILFLAFQIAFCAFVLSYTLKTMQDYQVNPVYILVCVLIYIITPDYNHFISVVIKDLLYSMFFALFITLLIRITREGFAFFHKKVNLFLWLLAVVGVAAMRNNGIYVLIPTGLIYIICSIKSGKTKQMILMWLIPLAVYFGINKYAELRFQPEDDVHASAWSLPLQQTARYVKYYADEITNSEYEAINDILQFDQLADKYDPVCSDPVKALFRENTYTTQKMLKYFGVWAKEFTKHPQVYFDAAFDENYYCFDLISNYNSYYLNQYVLEDEALPSTGLSFADSALQSQSEYTDYCYMFDRIPVIRLFNSMAVYMVLMIMMLLIAIKDRRHRELLYFVPLILSVLVIIAGPVISGNQRYALPIVYSMPVLIGVYYGTRETADEVECQ